MLRIFICRLLCAFSLSLTVTIPALGADQHYTVVPGDTLSSISERKHVSIGEIVRLNHLRNANYLHDGQVLQLTAAAQHLKHCGKRTTMIAARSRNTQQAWRVSTASANHPNPVAERQLWVAMHSGFSSSDFGATSFAAAQKAIVLEFSLTRTALRYLGVPYVWGGESASGVDCSGFVQAVFRRNGITLPRTADAQFAVGRRVSEGGLQPGDLVFFQTYAEGASHVGIYLGAGQFVHASSSNGVRVDSLSEGYYSSRFIGARRTLI